MAERFDELTEPELLALDAESIARWIDLECAYEGVQLLPPAPVAPVEPKMTPDVNVYEVAGLSFTDNNDALSAADFINARTRVTLQYVNGPRYDRIAKPADAVSVSTAQAFSPAAWDKVKDAANAYTLLKTKYDEANKEHSATAKAREHISLRINAALDEARTAESRRERMRTNYRRYLELAGGNRTTAIRFLKAAYGNASELLPEIDLPLAEDPGLQRAYQPE